MPHNLALAIINGLEQGQPITELVNALMIDWLVLLKIDPDGIINALEQADSEFEQIFELIANNKKIY